MADNGDVVHKISNSERTFAENLEFYHVYDETEGTYCLLNMN